MFPRHLKQTLRHTTTLICLGLSLQAGAAWAQATRLADLEAWAQTSAATVRLAQAEKDVAAHRAEAVRAQQGARIFGGATLGSAREAVTDTVSRSYQRTQLQAGVRWPLLGSREAQLRAVKEADQGIAARQVRLLATQQETVQAVRSTYLRHLHGVRRLALTQAYLTARNSTEQRLSQRTRAGYMLEAERMGLSGLFTSTAALQQSFQTAVQGHLRELSRWADRSIETLETDPIVWPAPCTHGDTVLAQTDEHPSVVQARLEVDAVDQIASHVRSETVDAGISVSQSVSKDWGGQPGRNTAVGIDVSMPLGWKAHRDALLGQLQSERFRAESLLELRRGEFRAAVDQSLNTLQTRRADLANAHRQMQIAQENLRVAALRQQRMDDGDGFARVLNARHAVFQAALQWVDAAERLDLVFNDLASWSAGGCPQATVAPSNPSSLRPVLLTLMSDPLPLSPPISPSRSQSAPTKKALAEEATMSLGWYAWDGQALLKQPRQLQTMPAGTQRVLLSFTARQLKALAQPPAQQKLTDLITLAHQKGIKVELLLGEPTWVLPAAREELVEWVQWLRSLPFDALHLDLERSQLPEEEQPLWDDGVIDTIRAVHAVSPWPVALTTHFRELETEGFAQRLHEAGASELTAMIYVSNADRAAEIARSLLQGPPGLKLSVAQSIEQSLPPEESSFNLGKAAALQRWQALAQALSDLPGFSGVIVQSWEEFKEARP